MPLFRVIFPLVIMTGWPIVCLESSISSSTIKKKCAYRKAVTCPECLEETFNNIDSETLVKNPTKLN